MAGRDLSRTDAAEFERSSLEYVLEKERRSADTTEYLTVEEAMRGESVYQMRSSRDITRILFISQDESLLNPTQQSLDGYVNLSDLFDEVHILILRQGIEPKNPVLRLAKNMWLYTASDKNWWAAPFVGKRMIEEQLIFADGFRPDLIVSRDPYESALLAIHLGRKYGRPVQIHVLEDYTHPDFLAKNRHNRWRRFIPRFTIPRVLSVRTETIALAEMVAKRFEVKNLVVLPRFNNYQAIVNAVPAFDLRQKYNSLVFIILFSGKLTHESTLYRVIDAARHGLANPRIGLVVLGAGPARKEFEERAKILGVKEQVIFEGEVKDEVSYLKSASVLVVSDTDATSEELVLRAAAAGVPMVMARTAMRSDILLMGKVLSFVILLI
jgi:glycosyltransferase involved in cell wall biosynthesis